MQFENLEAFVTANIFVSENVTANIFVIFSKS